MGNILLFIITFCLILTCLYFTDIFFDFFTNISINDHILVDNISKYIHSISNKKDENIDILYKNYLKVLDKNKNTYKSLVLYANFKSLLDLARQNRLYINDIIKLLK